MRTTTETTFRPGWLRRLTVAAALCALLLAGRMAGATVVPLSMEEMVAISDEVISVRVTDTTPRMANGLIVTEAKFTVVENFKGALQGEQRLDVLGGTYKGISMVPAGMPKLEEGEEAILFLSNPYRRLPEGAKAKLNGSSPLVNGLTFVGGWQGKLNVAASEDAQAAAKGASPIRAGAKVTRVTSAAEIVPALAQAPTYGTVSGAIRGLVAAEKQKRARKDAGRRIAGINGRFVVADRSGDAAVRAFDPLPSIAYMTDAELDALEKQVKEKRAAEKAAPEAGAKAAGEE